LDKVELDKWTGPCRFIADGREFIDLTSGGIFAAVLGGERIMLDATENCAYGAHIKNKWAEALKAELCEWLGFESCLLFCTGAEATEAWWRACRVYTGKPGIWGGLVDPDDVGKDIAPPDSMHGQTLGALIMAGKVASSALLGGRYGMVPDSTACAIWEPYHAPSAQFHRIDPTINRLKTLIKEFPDLMHCSDEIQAGLGRTGKLLGYQWYDGLKPAAVTLGKALGGGFPVSALLGPKEICGDPALYEEAHLHSTHSDHPVMAAAALAVVREIKHSNLVKRSREYGEMMMDSLTKGGDVSNYAYYDNLSRAVAYCGDDWGVRVHGGRGLLMGIEFADTVQADKVVEACRRRGVWVVHTGRKWVKLGPAFVITYEDMAEGMKRVGAAIEEVLSEDDVEARWDHGQEPGEGDGALPEVRVDEGGAGGDGESPEDDGPERGDG